MLLSKMQGLVAPLAGAWIETLTVRKNVAAQSVAPLAGAWIETIAIMQFAIALLSHPSRVRGLKPFRRTFMVRFVCRTPRGCVD